VTRLAVLVAALMLGGAAPALAQSAASDDPYDPAEAPSGPAAISLVKTASPAEVPEPGAEVEFAVTITHDVTDATAVRITTLVDDVHGDLDGKGSCVIPQILESGASYSCRFTAFVEGEPGDIEEDTVWASGTDQIGTPLAASDRATVRVVDVASALTVDKHASPALVPASGGDVTFSVEVTNTSAVDSVTVEMVTDDVYGDVGASCDVDLPHALRPGESFSCAFVETVSGSAGDRHRNVVTVSGVDDDGIPVSARDDAIVDVAGADPIIDLELSQHFDPVTVPAGSVSALTVTLVNRGPDPASGIVVTETLPDGVSHASDDAAGAFEPGGGTWTVGDLAVGATATLTITTIVGQPGEFIAVAEVTAADQRDSDSMPGDGTGDDWDEAAVAATTVLATSSIGGTVWIDGDADGVRDTGEGPFAGVGLRLTLPDGTYRWATSNAEGRYRFDGLGAGEYRVRVIAPDGWAPTTPGSLSVALGDDENYPNADFGLARGLPVTGSPLDVLAMAGALVVMSGLGLIEFDRRRRGRQIPTP
jgi:uncharacterized repeat protein (TIGR01451 family)